MKGEKAPVKRMRPGGEDSKAGSSIHEAGMQRVADNGSIKD